MKVKELIALLSTLDGEAQITIYDDNYFQDSVIKGVTSYGEGFTLYGVGDIFDKEGDAT